MHWRNAEPNNFVSLVSNFTLPPIYNKPLLHTSPWCRRLGISGITESFLWPTGFQPDHWQNQRCPAGPDVTRKLASKKQHLIDGNWWKYNMLTSLRKKSWDITTAKWIAYTLFLSLMWFLVTYTWTIFLSKPSSHLIHVGRSSTGSFPRGSARSTTVNWPVQPRPWDNWNEAWDATGSQWNQVEMRDH